MTKSKRARYKELIEEYGLIVVAIYLTTSLLVGIPAWITISLGVDSVTELANEAAAARSEGGSVETGGTLFLTWVVLKITQIPRLAVTIALTPLVGPYFRPLVHRRLQEAGLEEPDDPEPEPESAEPEEEPPCPPA